MFSLDVGIQSTDFILNFTKETVIVCDSAGVTHTVKPHDQNIITSYNEAIAKVKTNRNAMLYREKLVSNRIYFIRRWNNDATTGLITNITNRSIDVKLAPKDLHITDQVCNTYTESFTLEEIYSHESKGGLFIPLFARTIGINTVKNRYLLSLENDEDNAPGVMGIRIVVTGNEAHHGPLFYNSSGIIVECTPQMHPDIKGRVFVYTRTNKGVEVLAGESTVEEAIQGKLTVINGECSTTIKLYTRRVDAVNEPKRSEDEAVVKVASAYRAKLEKAQAEIEKLQAELKNEKSKTEDAKSGKRKAESGFWSKVFTIGAAVMSFVVTLLNFIRYYKPA